uniref:HECT-type E3 ubiquitin transferase n=1 Tax=Timema poppense TaxID=170557 RepID=A0A7R9DR31_TIMPO|nr:unnamed protein product [Timema poppensis]
MIVNFQPGKIFFCNYPFLFDAQAKTIVLQTDQSVQMQSAMNHAATQALTSMLFAPSQTQSISAFLQLFVDRNNLVQDTIRELTKYNTSELKKPLKVVTLTLTTTSTRSGDPTVQQVTFLGEEAVDAGGVTKEFFMLLLREILDPKYGMFRYHEETRTMWFSEDSFEDEIMYYLVGEAVTSLYSPVVQGNHFRPQVET